MLLIISPGLRPILFAAALVILLTRPIPAAEPSVSARDLPRIPPTEPSEALKTFRIKKGFRIELAAAEPLVVDPVAMAFDEYGRLFVVEMRDYSERRAERLGRVRLLVDTNSDGVFDNSTVYLEGLPWPTAVACWKGGVFIGATPDIFYCQDLDGDGRADRQEKVFTGFGSAVPSLNVQQLFNSFAWGLDNRIHGATAGNGGVVTAVARKSAPVDLRGRDFAFDPASLELAAESGGGQHGLSFDNQGRKFICSNSSHIRLVLYEDRYLEGNPFFAAPPAALDIAVDGPAAEVYRISPDEAWRVIRTRWRVAGKVPGPIEGGGRPSGYFTGATGITIYRGDAWPEEYNGDAFVADCGSNLIHRKKLRPKGVAFEAERPDDEQRVEFLASTDNWFRPVQMANGPDGALYVADMYREIIEHPASLPPSLKQHLDLNSGNDRGRIYRIIPDNYTPRPLKPLAAATGPELVQELSSRNGWRRDTAARLIYERHDKALIPLLRELTLNGPSDLGRLHALYALEGLGGLNPAILAASLKDRAPAVRRHGVRLSEAFLRPPAEDQIVGRLQEMVADPDLEVRYQLAFTLEFLPAPARLKSLAQLAARDGADSSFQTAILSSCQTGAGQLASNLLDSADRSRPPGKLLRQLCELAGAQNNAADSKTLIASLTAGAPEAGRLALLSDFARGLRRAGGSLTGLIQVSTLDTLYGYAARLAPKREAPADQRTAAIGFLGLDPSRQTAPQWLALLSLDEPPEIRLAALPALAASRDQALFSQLARQWPSFTPQIKNEIFNLFVARPERVEMFLGAIEEGVVPRSELSGPQIRRLLENDNRAIRERAGQLLSDSGKTNRAEVVMKFLPALELRANPERGRATFERLCVSCHSLEGKGGQVGPDLATVRRAGKEKTLTNILDPNLEVAPTYMNYLIETRDGQVLTGIIAAENRASIVLRSASAPEASVPRSNIVKMKSEGISAMPEGLESSLTLQEMADLLELLCGDAEK